MANNVLSIDEIAKIRKDAQIKASMDKNIQEEMRYKHLVKKEQAAGHNNSEHGGNWANKTMDFLFTPEQQSKIYVDKKGIQQKENQNNMQAVIDSAALGLDNFTTKIYKTLGLGNEYIRKYTDPVYMLTKKAFGTTPTDYMVETAKLGNEMRQEKAEQSNANASETVQAINQYVTEPVFETLPSTVLAIMSGGASAAGSGISQAANAAGKANAITNTLSNTVKSVVTNPSFYVSVASTYGPTYYDAKEMGATDAEALWVATISSAIGSAIEVGAGDVGGGLEKFVRNGNTRGLWEWVKSALEEGGEEVLQGIVDRATKATIISNPKEQMAFYSSDPNQPAVINPNTMAQEFIGGVTVSAILGGGTKLFGTAVNFVNNQQSGGSYDYSGNVQETAKAAGFTDTEVINQVAEWSASTKTPVLFTDKTFTDPVSGTQVDAIESDGVVFLSTKATNPMLELVVHEIAHTAQNTAQYQALLAEVKQSGMFASAGSWENAVARYQQYYAQEYNINYSFEQAQAEMVAKYIGENLYKSPESQKFVRQYMNGGLQRMLANRSYRQQYRAADAQGQQRLRQERALAEALRNRQKLTPEQIYATQQRIAEGDLTGAQYSTAKSFAQQVEDVIDGTHPQRYDLYVSQTPSYLVNIGFPEGPLLMRNGKIGEILAKHPEMSVKLIQQIPQAIQDPILVLKSVTHPDESVTIITDVHTKKGPLFVPVWVDQDGVYIDVDLGELSTKTNFVATAFGRNVNNLIANAVENGGILYKNPDEKRVSQFLARVGLQLPSPLKLSNSDINIPQNGTDVNTQYMQNGINYSAGNSRLDDIISGARDVDAEYQQAIDTYGAMDVDRPIETPKRVDDSGQKVSQSSSTFLNNAETEQEANVIKGGIVDAQYNHDTLKIETAKQKARARIDGENGIGYEAAAKDVAIKAADTDADAMLNVSPADYVYYGELYDMAVAQGDYTTAENCLLIMFEAASNSGKILAIQRNRMRNMLNGLSRSRAIQRDIARINNGFSAKYIEKYGRIEIPTEMYETLEKARTPEEIEAAEVAIYESAAEQWKATAWEKWRNYRYLAMLGNLKTWNKNTASNWANFGLSHSDNLISAAWQKMWGKFDFEKASVILWHKTELGKQIQPDVHARAQEMAEAEANHKYQDSPKSEIESRRKKFGDSKVGQLLEKASEGTDKIMQTGVIETVTKGKRGKKISGGDKAMFARAWEFYAGNYMVANNLTEITAEVENYATKAAQELVFHSDNAISKTVQKIRQSSKGAAAIIDFAMPFVKTPANVLQQGFQRSPVGLITNGIKLVKEMNASHKSGGKVSAETLNKFSRGVTGSMLMALGMLLSSLGIASGKEDESAKGRAGSELGGNQPLSFNVFGTSISFDWLEPASYPFLIGVLFEQGLEESDTSGAVIDAICAGYNEIFDMSMLAGLTEIFQQGSYGQDKNMIGDAAAKLLTNAVTQSIPTVVGQLARTIDPVKRKTTSGDSVFTDVLGDNFLSDTASTIAARIPFASKLLEPERDVWGNEVGRSGDSVLLNAVNQFVSPAALNSGSGYDDDLVTQIVMDLYERTGDAKVIPTELDKNKAREELGDDYNSKTFQELRQEVGDAQYEAIYELVTSGEPLQLYENYTDENGKRRRKKYNKTFDEMTDAEKVKAISSAASKAKTSAIDDYVEAFENILP